MENFNPAIAMVRGAEAALTALIGTILSKPLLEIDTELLGELSNIRHKLFWQEKKLIKLLAREERKAMEAEND